VLPGGVANPDQLRTDENAVKFVREFFDDSVRAAAPLWSAVSGIARVGGDLSAAAQRTWERKRALNEPHALLRDKTLAMLFFFTSTRTRGSFEAGMAQLGGHAAFIDSDTTQIAHGDTPTEIGEIYGRYFDGIAIRQCDWNYGNHYINAVAKSSRAPVLNMQDDIYHPFQILADLMTIIEKKGRNLKGQKMVVSWAYAASYQKPISVPQSLVLQMTRWGMDVVLAHPPEYKLMPQIMDQARANAKRYGGAFDVTDSMDEAFKGADIVYPKSWGALLTTTDNAESARIGRGGVRVTCASKSTRSASVATPRCTSTAAAQNSRSSRMRSRSIGKNGARWRRSCARPLRLPASACCSR